MYPLPVRRQTLLLLAALASCKEPKARVFTPEPPSDAERKAAIAGLSTPKERDAAFYRGVSLGLFASADEKKERSEIYRVLLEEIRGLGATDVQLVVRWAQRDVSSTQIAPDPSVSTGDEELAAVIAAARDLGLRVFLMPIIHLERRSRGRWRGTIAPEDWDAWWTAYERFVLHYAELAEQTGVTLFSVGSELVSTEAQEARWRRLISKVRERYRGKLTYSANWDHFEPVRIWDAVDIAGVTAYQPLSSEDAPSEQTLRDGWRSFRTRLSRWAATGGHRYLFTEVGYPSNPHAAARPWDHRERGSPNIPLQTACYRGLYETWQADDRLAGVFVWTWFGRGGREDQSYTPRGKPAAEILRHWYKGSSR